MTQPTRSMTVEQVIDTVYDQFVKQATAFDTFTEYMSEKYNVDPQSDSIQLLGELKHAESVGDLIRAVQAADIDEVENHNRGKPSQQLFPRLNRTFSSPNGVIQQDTLIEDNTIVVESDRYIPSIIADTFDAGGDLYMSRRDPSTTKCELVYALDEANTIIRVPEYEFFEQVFGCKRITDLPYTRSKIINQFGNRLSDDEIDRIAGRVRYDRQNGAISDDEDDTSSDGRRDPIPPEQETLNVSMSASHKKQSKLVARGIKDQFEDTGIITVGNHNTSVDMLVLFPNGTDYLLSDHYWIGGTKPFGDGKAAVANCNKSTYEYLADCDEVYHIAEFLDMADDHPLDSDRGQVSMGMIENMNQVNIVLGSKEKLEPLRRSCVIDSLTEAVDRYADRKYSTMDSADPDRGTTILATPEDQFWITGHLMEHADDCFIICPDSDQNIANVNRDTRTMALWKLYLLARLDNWDNDAPEMDALLSIHRYRLDVDDEGLLCILELLGDVHDENTDLYSESSLPQQWLL